MWLRNNILNNRSVVMFWLLTVAVLVLYDLTPRINGFDTPYYFLAGEYLWHGQLDCLRTPVYPLLLQSFKVCFGNVGIVAIVILQSIVYLFSVASLRNIACSVIKSPFVWQLVSVMYVVCVAPGWCNELLTESLSISGFVILTDWVFRYINQPSWRRSVAIAIMTALLVFLRPTFIFLFAVLPLVWIVLWIRNNRRSIQLASFVLTLLCVLSYLGYCKAYEKEFGVFSSTMSFVCNDVYNLKDSSCWDLERVGDPLARQALMEVDEHWEGHYGAVYKLVCANPGILKHMADGCNEMKRCAGQTFALHQLRLTVASFDKRFNASVDTHSPLSAVLFSTSLFLAPPLSLFYGLVVVSCIALVVYCIRKRTVPLYGFVLILSVAAQCLGIILYASGDHQRLLLPVYPAFLLLAGVALEKLFAFWKGMDNNLDR